MIFQDLSILTLIVLNLKESKPHRCDFRQQVYLAHIKLEAKAQLRENSYKI
jgi:hypothetical protein